MVQVLDNLTQNALRAKPDNLRLTLVLAHNDSCTTIQITDNGPGVPEDALPTFV